jgi:hypothetical protein
MISCKNDNSKSENPTTDTTSLKPTEHREFPAFIDSLFTKHGGYDTWQQLNYLTFGIQKPTGLETHQIDLKRRRDKMTTDKFSLGFDGKAVWLKQDSTFFKSNPKFYHNLMFYFYAMPFVLGDKGINYGEVEDLVYEGKTYKGVKISYESNVGDSPEDNYYLYVDTQTGRMAWLAYTVTFFSGAPSDKLSYIHYAGWDTFGGLLLPTRLEWHEFKDGKLGGIANTVNFSNISIRETIPTDVDFSKPEGSVIVE